MEKQIKGYIDVIKYEIQDKYSDEINLQRTEFEMYSKFDYINFHLIYKHILDDYESKKDFFIAIPDEGFRPNFYSSIFQSIVLIKLYQNYFNERKKLPIEIDDLVYCKKKRRIFKVKRKRTNELYLEYKFPKKNERGLTITKKNHNFYKINPNLSNGRNTNNNIKNYENYLKNAFVEDLPFITDFKNRTLVIAETQFFQEGNHLPIRYTNANGGFNNDLPFFNYMVECCNNFQSARTYLLDRDQTFDEILIIGDIKYRDDFDFILTEKNRAKYKNIIIIGTKKPNTENEFREWLWSNDEVKIASEEFPNIPKKVTLTNDKLYSILKELKSEIQKIKDESKVDLAYMLKFTNFFFRMILVNTSLSKGLFHEYLDRLNHYFQSDTFLEELNRNFHEQNIWDPDIIMDYKKPIFKSFSNIVETLENENMKWDYIKEKAKEKYPERIFLIIEKKNYDAVSQQLLNEKIKNINLISDKRIDQSKLYLDNWLKDRENSNKKLVIIPYLNNMELYTKIKAIKGICEVLCYENLDEISFDNVEHIYHSQEKVKLNHSDRKNFFETTFNHSTELEKRDFDDVFAFDLNSEDYNSNPTESLDLPKESAIYEVHFSDSTFDRFDSSKGVFLIENGSQIKTTIGEVYDNATIRFYQNDNKDEFRKILKIFDIDNLLDSFDKYSDSWKQTLKELKQQYDESTEKLYEAIFSSDKIQLSTFRYYFNENCITRFPRVKTMEIIRDFCINNNRNNDLIVKEFEKFIKFSRKDNSIRQQAGKILGNDLLDYVASNKEEKSETLEKLPTDILEKITATIQEKTITEKTLIHE